jgi:S1-C subfamily serine protease
MNKKQIVLVIVIITIIVWVADLLVGNYLAAKLSTSTWAQRFNLFNPQAPIVITNRETIRVNNSSDVVDTAENMKSKVSTLVYIENGRMVTTGSAVNWTGDGYFLAAKSSFELPNKVYAVVTFSGDIYPVQKIHPDPASSITILETSSKGLVVLDPADSNDLRVGEQIVTVNNSIANKQSQFHTGYIQRLSTDTAGQVMESDLVSRSIGLELFDSLLPGSAITNLSGRMIGIWDGSKIVPVEELRLLFNSFLSRGKSIVRPSLGFSYQYLSEGEAKALQTAHGAKVMGIAPAKPAALVGLKAGDVITRVGDREVDTELNLDNILRQVKPGDSIKFTVDRSGQTLEFNLTATQLK